MSPGDAALRRTDLKDPFLERSLCGALAGTWGGYARALDALDAAAMIAIEMPCLKGRARPARP